MLPVLVVSPLVVPGSEQPVVMGQLCQRGAVLF